MGYNLNRSSVIRNLPQLERIAREKRTLRFPHSNPTKLAYKLREAVAAAQYHAEFESIHTEIAPFVTFKCFPDAVIAVWEDYGIKPNSPASIDQVEKETLGKIITNATDLSDVMGALVEFSSYTNIRFPGVVLGHTDLTQLYEFASSFGWKLIPGQETLHVSKDSSQSSQEWTPEP